MAALKEQAGSWQDAYDAFQGYSNTYPEGLYAREAHEQSAVILMKIIKQQAAEQNYDQALKNLNLVTSNYSDTSVSAEAWTSIPTTYTSWGTKLREAEDFEKSEQVLHEFNRWVETNQRNDLAEDVKNELAQTYVAWGQHLQNQKQFEDAIAKFEQAVIVAPESPESVMQAKSGQRQVYIEWGNELLKQNELSSAMEKFEKAVALAEDDNDDGARDAMANGHIQWATNLNQAEDFLGALDQLQLAQKTAVSDVVKKSIDTALDETYVAFSNSTGSQAQDAMEAALKAVCEENKKPELPIFGLDKDSIRVGIYGLDVTLPENLGAKTPGELHYVACINEEKKTIDSKWNAYGLPKPPSGNYKVKKLGNTYVVSVFEYRVQFIWNVSLRKANMIGDVATAAIPGGEPPKYPTDWAAVGDGYLYGEPPDLLILIQWLQSHIE